MEGFKVIHRRPFDDRSEVWKIVIAQTVLPQLLNWYHIVLRHCG